MRRILLFLLSFSGLLLACRPQVIEVEVTRLVAEADDTAVSNNTIQSKTVEVTRLVPQTPVVVTRVVPQEVTIEVTNAPLGSPERPVQLLFAPVADTAVIMERTQPLVDALTAVSGREFTVGILDDEQAVIALMCAAPQETIGFLSAAAAALAEERCGAQVANVGVSSNELSWQAGMIVVRRDSGINSLADLEGRSWAVPDEMSIPNFLYFQAMLRDAGVTPGNIEVVPGDNTALLAVYNGEVDFATATYLPPILPFDEEMWTFGEDDPEPWRQLGLSPFRSAIGFIVVLGNPENGGYRVRDARAGIFDTTPGIFNETEILTLSAPIPNASVALGADFPLELARQVIPALAEFGGSEACRQSLCANDFYGWTGLEPAPPAAFEPLRFLLDTLDLAEEELLGRLQE